MARPVLGVRVMSKLPLLALLALSLTACGGAVVGGGPEYGIDSGLTEDSGPGGCQGMTPYCDDGCGGLQPEICEGNEWACPISGSCYAPPPDSGVWTEDGGTWVEDGGIWVGDGGIWTEDGGIWVEDGGIWVGDGGECTGPVPTCIDYGCGGYGSEPYCDSEGVWVCPPSLSCPPEDAGVCPGSPPECMSWCGDIEPSYCDADGNWACPPDLCDQLPDAGPPEDGGYYWNDGGVSTEDGGVIYGPDASTLACGDGCAPGYFCELEGITGPDPYYSCVMAPPTCGSSVSCACVIQGGGYDCPAPFGWTCTVNDGTVTVGCVAP